MSWGISMDQAVALSLNGSQCPSTQDNTEKLLLWGLTEIEFCGNSVLGWGR
jgi:hypothetical protein